MGRRKVEREMIEVFKIEAPVKGALFINRRTDRSLFIFGNHERKKKMVEDTLSIAHTFSSRLYGLRKYKKEIKEIVNA